MDEREINSSWSHPPSPHIQQVRVLIWPESALPQFKDPDYSLGEMIETALALRGAVTLLCSAFPQTSVPYRPDKNISAAFPHIERAEFTVSWEPELSLCRDFLLFTKLGNSICEERGGESTDGDLQHRLILLPNSYWAASIGFTGRC